MLNQIEDQLKQDADDIRSKVNGAAKNSHPYVTWILFLAFVSSIVFTTIHDRKTQSIEAYNHKELIDSISNLNCLMNKFSIENKIYQQSFTALLKDRKDIQNIQKQITISYENLQQQIMDSPDSIQFHITTELLAKHRAKNLERGQ